MARSLAGRTTNAVSVHGPPFRMEMKLPTPDRTRVDLLRQRMLDATLTVGQQEVRREAYRVAEVLYEKQNGPLLAARKAIPLVCEEQQAFLLTGKRHSLVDVSLAYLADRTRYSIFTIAQGIRRLTVRTPAGVVAVDDLVGPVGQRWRDVRAGYVEAWWLIPTDDARSRESFDEFREIFRQRRQKILDPVLVAEDQRRSARFFVVQGHHRAAAAFVESQKIRVAILRTVDELRRHVTEGAVAELVQRHTLDEFIEKCEDRSRRLGLYQGRWKTWLDGLP
jgi:hypothetical protein